MGIFSNIGSISNISGMLSRVLTNIKSILDLDTIEKYKQIRKDRDLEEIKLKNGEDLRLSLRDEFKDFKEIYNLMKNHIGNNRWLHFSENEVSLIFSEKLLVTYFKESNSIEEVNDYIEWNSNKNDIFFSLPTYEELEKLKSINFLGGGYHWYKKDDNTYSNFYVSSGSSYQGRGVYSIEEFF